MYFEEREREKLKQSFKYSSYFLPLKNQGDWDFLFQVNYFVCELLFFKMVLNLKFLLLFPYVSLILSSEHSFLLPGSK